ncbi:MAG TPA: tetratricopeptide repeat protein [Candidatus Binatia bacterium]|jgi:regulator of sirC expression with transglutaminase-like and TPR domain
MADDRHRNFRAAVALPDDKIDLGRAALAIAQETYPDLRIETYLSRMDQLAAVARDRSAGENSPYRLIACLNQVLFTQEGYRGNRDDYYDPRNSFLNDVIERRKGIPITLSVLYMEVARRVELKLHGIGFPGHFLVKYVGDEGEIVIDPFDNGEVRTADELQGMLDRLYGGKVAFHPDFLAPVSTRDIIQRMLNNLKAIYLRREDFPKALSTAERLVIIDPTSPQEIRDRGLLYLKLEHFSQAIDDFETYLRLAPEAADADEILRQVENLRKNAARLH